MVGKMVLGQKILTGLLIGGGSGWLVSPHSHQLEARLPWEGSSIPSKRLLTLGRTLNCLAESFLSKGHEPSPARSAHGTVHRCLWTGHHSKTPVLVEKDLQSRGSLLWPDLTGRGSPRGRFCRRSPSPSTRDSHSNPGRF